MILRQNTYYVIYNYKYIMKEKLNYKEHKSLFESIKPE